MTTETPIIEATRQARARRLVALLVGLASNRGADGSRGAVARQALAELSHGASFSPRSRLRMVKHVAPCLPERPAPDDEWFYVVAALFATHRSPLIPDSLAHLNGSGVGAALRQLKGDSYSIEGRLLALVNSGPRTLALHLRHTIGLLSSREMPLDWSVLLEDILNWKHPRRVVQQRWLREFYGAPVYRVSDEQEPSDPPDQDEDDPDSESDQGDQE